MALPLLFNCFWIGLDVFVNGGRLYLQLNGWWSVDVRSPNTTALKIIPLIYFILTEAMYNGIMHENIEKENTDKKKRETSLTNYIPRIQN